LAEPSHYTCTHAVTDDYSDAAFNQAESNDGTGVVDGSHSANLPDGHIQHAKYHVNDYDGHVADVTYDGVASHPEAVAHPVAQAITLPVVVAHLVTHVVAHPVAHAVAHYKVHVPVAHALAHHAAHARVIAHIAPVVHAVLNAD